MSTNIIYKSKNLFGVKSDDGEQIIPCAYDEITEANGYYYCRIWAHYHIYNINGVATSSQRSTRHWTNKNLPPFIQSAEDVVLYREGLDKVPLVEHRGILIKYDKGKFGALTLDKRQILPCEFDEIYRWNYSNVIYARNGVDHRYFDLDGNEILTKHRFPCANLIQPPYYLGESTHDTALVVKQFVNKPFDEQCCVCYDRPFRLDRIPHKEIEKLLREHCERIDYKTDDFEIFNGPDCYIYSAYIAHGQSIKECINELREMRCYTSSWHYLDKVLTNSKTKVGKWELALLKRAAKEINDDSLYGVGCGIDDSVAEDEIKVMHIEYYAERADWWNDPTPRKASDVPS